MDLTGNCLWKTRYASPLWEEDRLVARNLRSRFFHTIRRASFWPRRYGICQTGNHRRIFLGFYQRSLVSCRWLGCFLRTTLEANIVLLWQCKKPSTTWEEDDPLIAFQCLLLSRDAQATHQKDKVYGILGLSSIAKLVEITPDYALSVEQTFYSFSRVLCASGDLRYLRLVERPIAEMDEVYNWLQQLSSPFVKHPLLVRKRSAVLKACTCGLPSWVVCWRCPHGRTAHLLGRYTAAGQNESKCSLLVFRQRIENARNPVRYDQQFECIP